ncbi:cold shock CspA family protein [Kutzneria kofuensis]|uniref:Cold shock CspA family protein n=1 Tax=Kutzneria kofuensis TaxID=103725 RepID=A0A7W9KQ23_9PSEU|nr:cold shock CspA family protein [Kutzneria kofuensis]
MFVHHSKIQDYDHNGLADDQPVEFEVTQGQKGPQATSVHLL